MRQAFIKKWIFMGLIGLGVLVIGGCSKCSEDPAVQEVMDGDQSNQQEGETPEESSEAVVDPDMEPAVDGPENEELPPSEEMPPMEEDIPDEEEGSEDSPDNP